LVELKVMRGAGLGIASTAQEKQVKKADQF
jgi:hypothetical protein